MTRTPEEGTPDPALGGLGLFLPQLVHDVNNLCSTLLTCATFAREALPPDSEAVADLDEILGAVRELVAWMRRLAPVTSAMSRHAGGRTAATFDLAAAWNEVAPAVAALLDPVSEVHLSPAEGPVPVASTPRAAREALVQGALAVRLGLPAGVADGERPRVRGGVSVAGGAPRVVLEIAGVALAGGPWSRLAEPDGNGGLGPGLPSARGKARRASARWGACAVGDAVRLELVFEGADQPPTRTDSTDGGSGATARRGPATDPAGRRRS